MRDAVFLLLSVCWWVDGWTDRDTQVRQQAMRK